MVWSLHAMVWEIFYFVEVPSSMFRCKKTISVLGFFVDWLDSISNESKVVKHLKISWPAIGRYFGWTRPWSITQKGSFCGKNHFAWIRWLQPLQCQTPFRIQRQTQSFSSGIVDQIISFFPAADRPPFSKNIWLFDWFVYLSEKNICMWKRMKNGPNFIAYRKKMNALPLTGQVRPASLFWVDFM